MVGNDGYLTPKIEVRFRGWTEITPCHASTATGLVECEHRVDEEWLYRPRVSETAGAWHKEWSTWYLSNKDCLLRKKGCQFGWTTAGDEVTL